MYNACTLCVYTNTLRRSTVSRAYAAARALAVLIIVMVTVIVNSNSNSS